MSLALQYLSCSAVGLRWARAWQCKYNPDTTVLAPTADCSQALQHNSGAAMRRLRAVGACCSQRLHALTQVHILTPGLLPPTCRMAPPAAA
jgi:hypothetical protein